VGRDNHAASGSNRLGGTLAGGTRRRRTHPLRPRAAVLKFKRQAWNTRLHCQLSADAHAHGALGTSRELGPW